MVLLMVMTMDAETTVMNEEIEGTAETKSYSQEEVDELIAREADRRVTQALNTQKKKYEKQLSLSRLDSEAREKAEKDARIEELEAQLQSFTLERNKSEIKSVLSSRSLPAEFADWLNITEDATANQELIEKFDKAFKKAVTAEVERRLAQSGNSVKGNTSIPETMTKEQARKLSLTELSIMAKEQPELFSKLFN